MMSFLFFISITLILSVLTAIATEAYEFTPQQQQILSRIRQDSDFTLTAPLISEQLGRRIFGSMGLFRIAHAKIREPMRQDGTETKTEIHFDCKYPVVMDDTECVSVKIAKKESGTIWFVTFFYFK